MNFDRPLDLLLYISKHLSAIDWFLTHELIPIESLFDSFQKTDTIVTSYRVSGKTLLSCVYAIWYAITNPNSKIYVASINSNLCYSICNQLFEELKISELSEWYDYVSFENGSKLISKRDFIEKSTVGKKYDLIIIDDFRIVCNDVNAIKRFQDRSRIIITSDYDESIKNRLETLLDNFNFIEIHKIITNEKDQRMYR